MRSFRTAAAVVLCLAVSAGAACTDPPLLPTMGDPTGTARDTFEQSQYEAATILWVIDNSGSMCQEQANLRANFQLFMQAFRTVAPTAAFHMGVVTTDTRLPSEAGRLWNTPVETIPYDAMRCPNPPPDIDCHTGLPAVLPKWVDETTPDAERIFGCLASVGISGYGLETPLGAARVAMSTARLSDPDANAGFYIPGSLLVLVFVGDEDDCSVCAGDACGPLPFGSDSIDCAINLVGDLTPVADFVAFFSGIYDGGTSSAGDDVLVASIIGRDAAGNSEGPVVVSPTNPAEVVPICASPGQGSAAPAPRLSSFTRGFDSRFELTICDDDFGTELAAIGDDLGHRLNTGCLAHPPCPGLDAAHVVVRVTDDGGSVVYRPDDDYDVVCATAANACPASADVACTDGWRIDFVKTVPPGATVDVIYGFDAGDGCTAPM